MSMTAPPENPYRIIIGEKDAAKGSKYKINIAAMGKPT